MISLERNNKIATLTLQRAPLNILNIEMLAQLNQQLDQIASDREISVCVIRSAIAKGFSAGVDVNDHVFERVHQMLTSFHRIIRLLERWQIVSIAQVHGACIGGGAELAFGCDLVIAESKTEFGFPEVDLGCFPPVAIASLPNRVGRQKSCEWILTGRRFSAQEAFASGLVNKVVAQEALESTSKEFAEALAAKSPAVLRIMRNAIRQSAQVPFPQALWSCEEIYREQLLSTYDCQEGIRAFQEKRPPKWTGK